MSANIPKDPSSPSLFSIDVKSYGSIEKSAEVAAGPSVSFHGTKIQQEHTSPLTSSFWEILENPVRAAINTGTTIKDSLESIIGKTTLLKKASLSFLSQRIADTALYQARDKYNESFSNENLSPSSHQNPPLIPLDSIIQEAKEFMQNGWIASFNVKNHDRENSPHPQR